MAFSCWARVGLASSLGTFHVSVMNDDNTSFLNKALHRGSSALSLANWRTQHHFFDSAGSHSVHHSCDTSFFGYLRECQQFTLYPRNNSDHRICAMRTAHSGRNVALLRVEDMRSMPRPGLQASINIARLLLPSFLFLSSSFATTLSPDTVVAGDPVQRICTLCLFRLCR